MASRLHLLSYSTYETYALPTEPRKHVFERRDLLQLINGKHERASLGRRNDHGTPPVSIGGIWRGGKGEEGTITKFPLHARCVIFEGRREIKWGYPAVSKEEIALLTGGG